MSCFLAFWSDDFHNTVFSVLRASTRWAACETIQGPGLRLKKGENGGAILGQRDLQGSLFLQLCWCDDAMDF